MEATHDLDRKQILVVEDDFVLAREMCNELRAHGASIIGPAPTVHYARLIIGTRKLDGAVLDIKLFGEEVYALADDLMRDGVPMIFATAYRERVTDRFSAIETLHKPIDLSRLVKSVAAFRRDKVPPAPGRAAAPRVAPPLRKSPPLPAARESVFDTWSRALARVMRESL